MPDDKGPISFDQRLGSVSGLRDTDTQWYRWWYLRLRLEEECQRALRYKRPLSLVHIQFAVEAAEPPARELRGALKLAASKGLRSTDLPGKIDDSEFLLVLPETEEQDAFVVAERLAKSLISFKVQIAVASVPKAGKTAGQLIAALRSPGRAVRRVG